MKKLLKLGFTACFLIYYSCSNKLNDFKKHIKTFEVINETIVDNNLEGGEIFSFIQKQNFKNFNSVLENSKLCSIFYYKDKAIVYKFQCQNNSLDNFIDSDNKYYLIRTINEDFSILNYPQYVDYCKKPIQLNSNWLFIEQNITYD